MEWDELENFFGKSLSQSQALNDSSQNDEGSPVALSLARELTKSLQANFELKRDLDDLHCSFMDFKKQRDNDQIQYRNETFKLLETLAEETTERINKSESKITVFMEELSSFQKEFDELINVLQNIDVSNDDINSRITKLDDLIDSLKNIDVMNTNFNDRIRRLETRVTDLNQYGRRPTIEISGVSEDIPQSELEKYVALNILHPIGIRVGYWDISTCHRLAKKNQSQPSPVVVRFVNRKHAVAAIKNRFLLKYLPIKDIFITDNLCPENQAIFDELCRLKNNGVVSQVWSYNGKPTFKASSSRRVRGTRVDHLEDLKPLIAMSPTKETQSSTIIAPPATVAITDKSISPPITAHTTTNTTNTIASSPSLPGINEVSLTARTEIGPSSINSTSPIVTKPSVVPADSCPPKEIDEDEAVEITVDVKCCCDLCSRPFADFDALANHILECTDTHLSQSAPEDVSIETDLLSESLEVITSPAADSINSILSSRSPGNSSPQLNCSVFSSSSASVCAGAPTPTNISTKGPEKSDIPISHNVMNSTSTEPHRMDFPEVVVMDESSIEVEAVTNGSVLHPTDDPVLMKNIRADFEALRTEYEKWESPRRNSNLCSGSRYVISS